MPARPPRNRDREALRRARLYTARQTVHNRQGARRRRDNVIAAIVLVLVVIAATLAQIGFFTLGPGKPADPKPTSSATPTPRPTATSSATPTPAATSTAPTP